MVRKMVFSRTWVGKKGEKVVPQRNSGSLFLDYHKILEFGLGLLKGFLVGFDNVPTHRIFFQGRVMVDFKTIQSIFDLAEGSGRKRKNKLHGRQDERRKWIASTKEKIRKIFEL